MFSEAPKKAEKKQNMTDIQKICEYLMTHG